MRRIGQVVAMAAAVIVAGLSAWGLLAGRDEAWVGADYRAGRLEAAWTAAGRWIDRRPGSGEAWLWKARIGLAMRRPAEASEALRKADALGADRHRVEVVRAIAMGQGGRLAEAEPMLRDEFNAHGEPDVLLDETLARIYLETYDMVRAASVITRWMLDAPGDAKPYLWRAEVDSRTNNSARLLDDYREALARDPRSAPARIGLAEELRKAHRNVEAAAAYASYLELRPDDPAGHLGAGRNDAEMGKADTAMERLRRAAALAPGDPIIHRAIADLLIRRGDFPAAIEQLDLAAAADPFDLETRHSRGLVLTRLGHTDEARAEQARATQLRAELGDLLAAQTQLVRAPNNLNAQLKIAGWMFAHGKPSEGVRWAETILRNHRGHPEACRLLIAHYEKAGQPGLANLYRAQTDAMTPPR